MANGSTGGGYGAGGDFPARPGGAIRVFVVDDHQLVRQGLIDLICFEDDLLVVGEAESVATAVAGLAVSDVDVAIVDLMLTDGTGVEVCRWLRSNQARTTCLVITSLDDTTALRATILAGAAGYVSKTLPGLNIADVVRAVGAGGSLLDPAVLAAGRRQLRALVGADHYDEQEREILGRVIDGRTDREIADELGLPIASVAPQVTALVAKTEVIRSRLTSGVSAAIG